MKCKMILFFTLLCASASVISQISVGNEEFTTGGRIGKLNDRDYEAFKKSTTYFVIPPFDTEKKETYETLLKSLWTVTPIKVLDSKEFESLKTDVDKSIIRFKGISVKDENGGQTFYYQFKVVMFYISKKGDLIEKDIATSEFNIKYEAYTEIVKKRFDMNALTEYMNKTNYYHNYSLGYIKNYLTIIHDNLATNTPRQYKSKEMDKVELKNMKNDTLFIMDCIKDHPDFKLEETFAKTKFKYKIISMKALSDKIITSSQPFYYLNYERLGYLKTVNIINSKTGTTIYNNFTWMGFKP
jgi:hypothetical protein